MGVEIPQWLKAYLRGWINIIKELIWHFEPGQTVTLIRSDAPFEVPSTLPGGAQKLESVQYTFDNEGVVIARVLERQS